MLEVFSNKKYRPFLARSAAVKYPCHDKMQKRIIVFGLHDCASPYTFGRINAALMPAQQGRVEEDFLLYE